MTAIIQATDFENLTAIVVGSLSESSKRVYRHTYSQWTAYARDNGFGDLDFTFERIRDFVQADGISHSARLQRLSHIKTLLKLVAIADPSARQLYEATAFIKVQRKEDGAKARSQRALSFTELRKLLDAWQFEEGILAARNLALIHVAVYTGMRRNELAHLRWTDVDLCGCSIQVRIGKGGKSRTVAIADATDGTCQVLRRWKALQDDSGVDGFAYVFPRLTRGKSPGFASDKPMAGNTVMTVVNASADRANIGHISPHDLRRTHITLALDNGATVADMQAQAGHAKAETTMLYAQAADAKARKARIEF